MEITPGRAVYSPDEELKPLRSPKNYRSDYQTEQTLSVNAAEFVPRFGNMVAINNVQERLQRHQRQYIQQNYQQYQQPQHQQQQQPQQQYHNQQSSYSNGYGQQQQQQQHQQQLQQPSQSIHTQMNGLNLQDRLRTNNNAGGGGGRGGYSHYQNQQRGNAGGGGSGGQQQEYQQNNHYRYNKNHHHNPQQQPHHHHQHQQHHRYNNQQQQQQQQQHHQPQYHQQNQHYHQQQQTQQQQQQHQQQQSSAQSTADDSPNEMETIALDYLQSVIQCLNQNPGQFDSIASRFITIFDGMENNHYVLSIAMEDIFNESIKNPNFRYMGAKLYNLLHMLNPSKDSLFHSLLECKLVFHQQEMKEYMESKQEAKVRETALFLAELYMQLRGDDSRIYLIAENIVYSLQQLLSSEENKENIRCICLTLKLAGYDLTADCAGDMQVIISKLDAINCQNPGKYPLANNVIALQKNNWGRKASGSDSLGDPETSKPPEPLRLSDDPIFYGPDGREITAEECEFLTNGANGGTAGSTDNDDDDDLHLDDEMDEETERDYKMFLKQAANNKS